MKPCPLCDPAEARPVDDACVSCGREVCAGHRWTMLGLCHGCATSDEVLARARAQPTRARDILDIKWID